MVRTTLMSHDYDDAQLTWNKVVKSFLITSNKFKHGLPRLPSIKISEFIANNIEVYAGESSCPLKICPNS